MRRREESWKETLAFHGYRLAAWLARTLPKERGHRLFERFGILAHSAMPGLRATVSANQAQVLGRPADDPLVRASTREAFVRYARYWFDAFRMIDTSDAEILERFCIVDEHHLWDALEGGKGAIVALPHMGNWDAAGRYMAARGHPLVAVAERLRPERLFELFVAHRRELGMEIIGLSAGVKVGRQLTARLAENCVVALVADRDLTGRGVEVDMFGRQRRLPAGPALLSLSTGAPLLVTPVYQTTGGWRSVIGRPVRIEPSGNRRADVDALTRLMAEEFERAISAAPADWHMFQPAWEP